MNTNLEIALAYMTNARAALIDAGHDASAVESLVIMPLIGDAQRIINQINAIIAAKKET